MDNNEIFTPKDSLVEESEAKEAPKPRRGRKKKTASDTEVDIKAEKSAEGNSEAKEESKSVSPKRRGRPPKKKPVDAPIPSENIIEEALDDVIAEKTTDTITETVTLSDGETAILDIPENKNEIGDVSPAPAEEGIEETVKGEEEYSVEAGIDESETEKEFTESQPLETAFGFFGDFNVDDSEATEEETVTAPEQEDDEVLDGQLEIDFGDTDNNEDNPEAANPKPKVKKGYDADNPRRIDTAFDFIELFIFALVAVLVFTTFFFRHSVVDGGSMENTLHDGEHLIISNLFYTPERGDIIVCEDYSTGLRKPIVKRVIGVAGDHVQVSSDGRVTLNGEFLDEDYIYIDTYFWKEPKDIVVPEGEIFVMGDHRNVSYDSRDFETINCESVIGKVLIRFYPFDRFGTVE